MVKVLYEDSELIVVVKPAGVEAQSARRFAPDMVSEIKKHLVIHKLCTPGQEPYVAVIHRLDKPVSGIMVYGKTKNAAAALSKQVQNGEMEKIYLAVVCGKPVNNVDKYVDYLKKSVDGNYSQAVDMGITGAKRAELSYEVMRVLETQEPAAAAEKDIRNNSKNEYDSRNGNNANTEIKQISLLRIHLKTGRHHQIRVQMAAHGHPVYGDGKYGTEAGQADGRQEPLALCAASLAFRHPKTGKRMEFSIQPSGGAFEKFFHGE